METSVFAECQLLSENDLNLVNGAIHSPAKIVILPWGKMNKAVKTSTLERHYTRIMTTEDTEKLGAVQEFRARLGKIKMIAAVMLKTFILTC